MLRGRGFYHHCEQTLVKRGTSSQLRSSDSARKREWAQLRKQNLSLQKCQKRDFGKSNEIDCHDSATAESRNDRMSPSLAEGDKGGGYQYAINANDAKFMNVDSTLPLAHSC
ncbi:hypothetical protein [Helicobacter sp. T3_23-1056]